MNRHQRVVAAGALLAVTAFANQPGAAQIFRIAEMNTRQIEALERLRYFDVTFTTDDEPRLPFVS